MATQYRKNSCDYFSKIWYKTWWVWLLMFSIPAFLSTFIRCILPSTVSLVVYVQILSISVLTLYILLTVAYLIYQSSKYGGIKKYYNAKQLEKRIIKSFIDTMSVNKALQTHRIYVPKSRVDLSTLEEHITVYIERLPAMNDVELLVKNISSAFNYSVFKNYAVVNYIEFDDMLLYKFILEDVNVNKTIVPKNINDLIVDDMYSFVIQKNLIWNMNKQPHLLLSGKTGSGKSTFLLSLILQMFYKKVDLYIIDPKFEFSAFTFYGDKIYSNSDLVLNKMIELVELLEKREKQVQEGVEKMKKIGLSAYDLGLVPTVILVDEMSALVAGYDSKQRKVFDSCLVALAQKGRSSGIFLIVSMQNTNSESIKVAVRNQFGFRILLGNSTSEDIQFMFSNNNETVKKTTEKFSGYYTLDGYTEKPQKIFVPDLHKYGLNKLEVFENAYLRGIGK